MNKKDPFSMKRVLKEHRIGALKDVPIEIVQQMHLNLKGYLLK